MPSAYADRGGPAHISVALTGMMGAGKSTVAISLARLLHLPLVSTDARVEAAAGESVARIFESQGELAFRAMERGVVRGLRGPCVIDLGGGAFCDPGNAEHLLRMARVVFLDVSANEAHRRVGDRGDRPLIADWEPLSLKRLLFYRRAHVRIFTDGLTPEAIARRILGWL